MIRYHKNHLPDNKKSKQTNRQTKASHTQRLAAQIRTADVRAHELLIIFLNLYFFITALHVLHSLPAAQK